MYRSIPPRRGSVYKRSNKMESECQYFIEVLGISGPLKHAKISGRLSLYLSCSIFPLLLQLGESVQRFLQERGEPAFEMPGPGRPNFRGCLSLKTKPDPQRSSNKNGRGFSPPPKKERKKRCKGQVGRSFGWTGGFIWYGLVV